MDKKNNSYSGAGAQARAQGVFRRSWRLPRWAQALVRFALLMLAVSFVTFVLVGMSPIDPVQANTGQAAMASMTPARRAELEAYWGVGTPVVQRYLAWLGRALQGNLGLSLRFNQPVTEVIAQRAGGSLALMVCAWVLSGVLGVVLGVVAGACRGRRADRLVRGYCYLLSATPAFWLGMVALMVFAVGLGWFPLGFSAPIGVAASQVTWADRAYHLVLPALVLSLTGIANIALATREKTVEVLGSDYARFARTRGEDTWTLVRRHGLRNLVLPALTLQFASISEIFGGSVLVEQVFSYPGLGQAAVTAGLGGDAPLLVAVALVSAALVFAGNAVANLLYGVVDPRLRRRRRVRVHAGSAAQADPVSVSRPDVRGGAAAQGEPAAATCQDAGRVGAASASAERAVGAPMPVPAARAAEKDAGIDPVAPPLSAGLSAANLAPAATVCVEPATYADAEQAEGPAHAAGRAACAGPFSPALSTDAAHAAEHDDAPPLTVFHRPRNRGAGNRRRVLVSLVATVCALAAVVVAGRLLEPAAVATDFAQRSLAPSAAHPFGTDWMGRDMLARTLAGLSTSVLVGLVSSAVSSVIALALAALAALGGRRADAVVSWLIDLTMGIPHLVLLILISYALGRGAVGVLVGVAVTHWPSLARLLRAEILQCRTQPFVDQARALGVSPVRLAVRHMVPYVLPQYLVGLILLFPHAILHEASVTFLGFGLPAEMPAVGVILSEAMSYLASGAWWLAVFPGAALLAVVLVFDRVGAGLRRLLDARTVQD